MEGSGAHGNLHPSIGGGVRIFLFDGPVLTCRLPILARPTWQLLGPIRGIGPRGPHMVVDFDLLKLLILGWGPRGILFLMFRRPYSVVVFLLFR